MWSSPGNYRLFIVDRFVCPCEPGGCVVWSLVRLVGSPKSNWPQVRGQIKNSSKRPHDETKEEGK